MPATIGRATGDDAERIAEIIAEVTTEPISPAQVEAWIDRRGEDGAMFVVDDSRDPLAFAAPDFDSSRPDERSFGARVRARIRRQGHGTALAEEALAFAPQRGYRRIRARLPGDNERALPFLSAIGAIVPLTNPGASFELPICEEHV